MSRSYDAVVIGAGHNGLVTAVYLARAGWSTLVLEGNAEVGGAIRSAEVTAPGFVSDVYSTNQNPFLASPVYQELRADLERHGLRYRTAPDAYGSVFPGGLSLKVSQDRERTLAGLRDHDPADAAGWSALYERYQAFQRTLLPLSNLPMPSLAAAAALARGARAEGVGEVLDLAKLVLCSTRELGDLYLSSPEAKALFATWGMHLDFAPDVSGGAMFPLLETFGNMERGMSIVEGGASRMPEALVGLLRELGGEVRTYSPVQRILTSDDRAVGVELESGEHIKARRAVVGNVTPTALAEGLLGGDRPAARQAARYRFGPGTMMVHLAVRGRTRWLAGGELGDYAYVHIAPYTGNLAQTYLEALDGQLPTSPLLIVGQTSAIDPTRAPEGHSLLWIQVRALPREVKGDAAGEINARNWEEAAEPMADRVVEKLEAYAPGISERILARAVLSPEDLERENPNLVGGDSVAGSHHLFQNFLFRPFPGWSRHRTPVESLYLVGAATWPGGGTNGTSGYLGAREILRERRTRRTVTAAAAGTVAAAAVGAGAVLRARR